MKIIISNDLSYIPCELATLVLKNTSIHQMNSLASIRVNEKKKKSKHHPCNQTHKYPLASPEPHIPASSGAQPRMRSSRGGEIRRGRRAASQPRKWGRAHAASATPAPRDKGRELCPRIHCGDAACSLPSTCDGSVAIRHVYCRLIGMYLSRTLEGSRRLEGSWIWDFRMIRHVNSDERKYIDLTNCLHVSMTLALKGSLVRQNYCGFVF